MSILKTKRDLHLARKIWHAAGISLMAILYNYLGIERAWLVLGLTAAIFIPLDIFRLQNEKLNFVTLKILGNVMRENEKHSVSAFTYLIIGTMLLIAIFDRHIVTLTFLFLAFGDPMASFVGIKLGKDKIIGNKTLQGTIAAFFVCAFISSAYYYANNIMTERLLIVSLLSGIGGALAELTPIAKLDDNLSFPVLAGSFLWIIFTIYGGFAL